MKKSNVNKEAEAIEFLKSIGYRFDANEKQFFPGKEEIAETYPLDFLKERLAYNDMLFLRLLRNLYTFQLQHLQSY